MRRSMFVLVLAAAACDRGPLAERAGRRQQSLGAQPADVRPAPDQPANEEPGAAVAVRLTSVPLGKSYEQIEPQLIPAGELVTVPDPLPANATDRV